jgi:cyclophilin family peptidyl-prolyl cis-trans isomerase/HEAT repeat protein
MTHTHHSSRLLFSQFRTIGFFFVLSLLFTAKSSGQTVHFSSQEKHLIQIIDDRRDPDSLEVFLNSSDSALAWRAAVGLANIGEKSSRKALIKQLASEQRPYVIDAIAFALGTLGPDSAATQALLTSAFKHSSIEILKAIGRTAPESFITPVEKYLDKSRDMNGVKNVGRAELAVELALRKISTIKIRGTLDELAADDNPEVRWRAAYAFARTDDSAGLVPFTDRMKELLVDQGTPLARMFAATALGRMHNAPAEDLLIKAFKGEQDWHVVVNILNALGRSPKLDTNLLDVLKTATLRSNKDDNTSDHVSLTALAVLEQLVTMGRVGSTQDSASLREWVKSFAPRFELYPDISIKTRSATLPILARLGDAELNDELGDFNNYRDLFVRGNGVRAAAALQDTGVFARLLESVSVVTPPEQIARLEALDSIWKRAAKHPEFRAQLESRGFANAYRHMIIRISDLILDPGVVGTALEQMKDSLLLVDSIFRKEAANYLQKYLVRFQDPKYHDQLIGAIDAARWLGRKDKQTISLLNDVYTISAKRGAKDVMDSAAIALKALGEKDLPNVKFIPNRQPIDWYMLEHTSDTLIVNTKYGFILVRMLKHDAPLTCINTLKLSQSSYFANNVFHRVVPNFVVQSGDQSGTGWGGPGYTIRREIAPVSYSKAGMMGMASSGKDTEGSQWFITHIPTPNLDARYTIFGEVIVGMDRVDKVLIGDQVENVVPLKR